MSCPRKIAAGRPSAAASNVRAARRSWSTTRQRVGQNCEFCGSPALVSYDEIKAPIRPHGVLPFKIDRSRVRDDIRRWWRSKWLAPGKLASMALVDTVHSLYIPYWTFDASVHCPWHAEAGHYYYVNVQGRDSKGNSVMRRERRVRWEAASGVVDHVFDDEPVPGRRGCRSTCCARWSRFPTGESVNYDTAFLAGHVVEHYKVVLARRGAAIAGADARASSKSSARRRCRATRIATCGSIRRIRARRSSTCSCRSGCSPTTTAARRIR